MNATEKLQKEIIMKTMKGLKYLDPTLCTDYNGVRTSYLPAVGKWMTHPKPARPDGYDPKAAGIIIADD